MDRSFVAQLNDYRITTAEILYWMPDHTHVLQSFVWQNLIWPPISQPHLLPRFRQRNSRASCIGCGK
jgi:uncharacterized protein Usg